MKLEKATKTHVTITFTRNELELINSCTSEWPDIGSEVFAPEKTVDTNLGKLIVESMREHQIDVLKKSATSRHAGQLNNLIG